MVYQGKVWRLPLRNILYEYTIMFIHIYNFCEIVFADDLNAYKTFALATPNDALKTSTKKCQLELHKRGRANQLRRKQTIDARISIVTTRGSKLSIIRSAIRQRIVNKRRGDRNCWRTHWKDGIDFPNGTFFHWWRAGKRIQKGIAIVFGIPHSSHLPRLRQHFGTAWQISKLILRKTWNNTGKRTVPL